MKSDWTQEWKVFSAEEQIVGVNHKNREQAFLLMGHRPDFRVTLVSEPTNPRDKNAIKVVGAATVKGFKAEEQLGYLSRDTARVLKGKNELDAKPCRVILPYQDSDFFAFMICVLVKSEQSTQDVAQVKKTLATPNTSAGKKRLGKDALDNIFDDMFGHLDDPNK